MLKALDKQERVTPGLPTIGVFATGDPRLDEVTRERGRNIVRMIAETLADRVKSAHGDVRVVWTPVLVDGEAEADIVAGQFKAEGVEILVCAPDTWAFPQLGLISLLSQFPADTPVNLTCGNSGPKPGVVFTHAASGAISQYGKLVHINVGTWPDTGQNPEMSPGTADALVDWTFAALTRQYMKGRRAVVFGHDSMGMETALAHVIPTRKTFGMEIARLDMKLLSDMLQKRAYDTQELAALREWVRVMVGDRVAIPTESDEALLQQGLAMYLVVRDLLRDLNAISGGFMNQLEWGSDRRGVPMPVVDVMESMFNSTFDHNGPKAPLPFATEADVQGLLTMLPFSALTAGAPPLFMDFRKVWEPWEICGLAERMGLGGADPDGLWRQKGLVDGDNSGSAAFDWAALPGTPVEQIMSRVEFPQADEFYFPGLGNSVTFISPGGIEGIAGRMAYSALNGCFSMVWDEACTVDLPAELARAVAATSTSTWPHTWVVPKYASMGEYKQFAPANHFHMIWGLKPARLQYWMDMANVLSLAPWQARPTYLEGVDRPTPLLYLLNGGENATKMMLAR